MAQHTIAFVAQKGGVGKTTLACSFASECLARDHRVLIVDTDPQSSTRTWASIAFDLDEPTPDVISMGATMHRRGQLQRISEGYDVVVIDTPPRHSPTMRSALHCADVAILPCGPSATDAWALGATIEAVHDAQQEREDELLAYIAINRAIQHTHQLKSIRPVLEGAGVPLMETELCARVAYSECMAVGRGVIQYAPVSAAAREMRVFVDEVWRILDAKADSKHEATPLWQNCTAREIRL